MFRLENHKIHYEVVGVIGNQVHFSPDIKKDVLLVGALQLVIELLSKDAKKIRGKDERASIETTDISYALDRKRCPETYREREAKHIGIPNIKWDVFELMMRFTYNGTVDVSLEIVGDLLKVAD
ncbi:hypothetical protein VNO77_02636 [Canavalia gladiata]|uniref:BTB domain-containing protein n=1 Tax=Canavalia gladiata TaxID=3824 RepID=A0AAN9MYD1_CANGL